MASTQPVSGRRPAGSGRATKTIQLHQVVPLVERQHALIEALRVRTPRSVAAADLAKDLGVSSRTIERDIARLIAAGVPILVRKGPGGGYSINAPRRLPVLQFTPGEVAAMISALATIGPYTSATAQSALAKLLTALDGGECPGGQAARSGPGQPAQ